MQISVCNQHKACVLGDQLINLDRESPVQQGAFLQQHLHNLDVAILGGQVQGCQTLPLCLINDVCPLHALQQTLTRVQPPVAAQGRGWQALLDGECIMHVECIYILVHESDIM